MSPTSYAVIKETLKRSPTIAEETSKSSIAVTFDLAIAKIAMQIQHEESPTYDKISINLGGFHIEMAYSNAIGKYIDESGGPYILIEAEVLAFSSPNGFIKGKRYNRCKRLHPLLSATFEILHLESFIESSEFGESTLTVIRSELRKVVETQVLDMDALSRELFEFLIYIKITF